MKGKSLTSNVFWQSIVVHLILNRDFMRLKARGRCHINLTIDLTRFLHAVYVSIKLPVFCEPTLLDASMKT